MKKLALIVALAAMTFGVATAQRSNVKAAFRLSEQSKPDFEQAQMLISAAEENPETMNDPETYYVAAQINENEFRHYLDLQQKGQEVDIKKMYDAALRILPALEKCYELDNTPNANGKVKAKYTKKIQEILKRDITYVYNGGVVFSQSNNQQSALDAFVQYFKIKDLPVCANDPEVSSKDSTTVQIALIVSDLASSLKQPDKALLILQSIKTVPGAECQVLRGEASAYKAQGDTVKYLDLLKEGASKCSDFFFFASLVDLYSTMNKTDEAIKYLDDAIKLDPNNPQLYRVMGDLWAYQKNDTQGAIKWYKKALEIKPDDADFNYAYAMALFNEAADLRSAANVTPAMDQKAMELFKMALPILEKADQLRPNDSKIRYMLKNVYYNLRMMDKYKAMGGE